MKIAAFAALLALSFAGVAHAREPTDAAKVASYCTAQGAFGQSFGATAISGRLKMQSMNSEFVTPGALYPPTWLFAVLSPQWAMSTALLKSVATSVSWNFGV